MAETTDAVLDPPLEDIDLAASTELEYAGFWSRVAALIVDNAVVTIFGLALLIAAGLVGEGAVVIANLLYLVIAILYWPLMESSERQATIGKQLLGIQVVDANGARLNFVRALLRNLAKILSSLPFGLGFLLAAFTAKKQALHDLITKCLVVRAGPSRFMKAVVVTVGALLISIFGGYYYVTEFYLPQMAEDMGRPMEKGMKPAQVAKPKAVQPPVAKAPAPAAQPAPGAAAPGGPKPMTPQEIAEFEKKMQQAKPVSPAPKPAPVAVAKPKPESAPVAAAAAKPKPAAVEVPKPKPAVVDVPKPKPVPAPAAEAPAASAPVPPAPARPVEPRAPAAPPAVAPGLSSRIVRSPKFNDVMTCVMFRDAPALAELLELGWWVDRPDSNGITPLMAAAWNGDPAMAQLLLKAGADPNRRAPGGSVLEYAGRSENALVIQMLRSSGAR
ncbi:MAG TPA: RDD family protein [Burkholderiales bacterium]